MSLFTFQMFSKEANQQLQRKELNRGDILFTEGAKAESVFFVESGCIRLEVHPENDKQLVLYRARENEAFAEEHLVLHRYSYQAVADEKSIVQYLPKQALLEDIRVRPDVAQKFITCLSLRHYQLRINFERLGIKSAKNRVLHLLQTMSLQGDCPIDVTGKIKSFSNDLNLTHEATYRALKELERDGLIQRENGSIILVEISNL